MGSNVKSKTMEDVKLEDVKFFFLSAIILTTFFLVVNYIAEKIVKIFWDKDEKYKYYKVKYTIGIFISVCTSILLILFLSYIYRNYIAVSQFANILKQSDDNEKPLSNLGNEVVFGTDLKKKQKHTQNKIKLPKSNNSPNNDDKYRTKPTIRNYDELILGKVVYNIPDSMLVGRLDTASVYITRSLSDSILIFATRRAINRKGNDVVVDSIPVSSRVKVSLIDPSGDNFYIKSVNNELQFVDDRSSTVWKWYIKPLTSGNHNLELTISTQIKDDVGENFRDIPAYNKVVIVNSDYIYSSQNFFGKYWQWILGSILLPLTIWSYNIFIAKRTERQKKLQDEESEKINANSKKPIGFDSNQKKP